MANYNTNSTDYKLVNYHNNNNNVKRKESIHSGHFMISQFEVDEEEEEMTPQAPQDDIKMVIEPATIVDYNQSRPSAIMLRRNRVQSSVIETSLTKLFECMSLAYRQKLTSPKWNRFKGIRLRWKDKIRLNNVIWRCWHMQFIIKKNALVCQFASPLDADTHNKPEAVVLEGKYWKRKLHAVTAEYKKWRQFFHFQRQDSDELADMLEWQPSSNESNSNASMLLDEDYMEFMSDTLFSTLSSQPFFFPDSKELARVASIADFIQPSLVQLQPNLDDLMEVFEPFHDMICSKLPTVPEEQFPSPSSSLPTSLPSHLSQPSKHRPNPSPVTIIATQSGSIQSLPSKQSDYLSSNANSLGGKEYSANLAVNNLTSALAGNNINNIAPSLTGNALIKPEYHRSQSANLTTNVKPGEYQRNIKLGASQPLHHHHPNIIYSRSLEANSGAVQTSGGSTLTNTGTKSVASESRGKAVDVGYNFAMTACEKPSVFSYAPAAPTTPHNAKATPPPDYPYSGVPTSLKSRENDYASAGHSMYNSYDIKPNIVQYNYGGKSVQYATDPKSIQYATDPKSVQYATDPKSIQYATDSNSYKQENPYGKSIVVSLSQEYDKLGASSVNQGYDKVVASNLNQGYDKVGVSSVNQGYDKVASSNLNHGYDKSSQVNQVNQISGGHQYGSYGPQYTQDTRNEYNSNSGVSYSSHQSQLSYPPSDSSYTSNSSMGPGAQYAHHQARPQHTPPTPAPAYSYYREHNSHQQALDFKLPSTSPSTLTSPYRSSLVQPPLQSPESLPAPHSPGNMRRPGTCAPGEEYSLPPKPQAMKTRHRTRSSCNLMNPKYFLNTATDPNLVHHNSALLAQLLTSNSHTSYGGLPKASAVCTGETISCPGYTGRSRTPDSVYVPPPQEQVVPPAPPSYPPYPPKSAFLVSSQSEGSLFNLINSRAANFSQQNSLLQRQTKIIQQKNQQQAQQRNIFSGATSQSQSQYNMSGASSTSSLAATSPSSKHPDSPPEPLSPPVPSPPHHTSLCHRPSPYKWVCCRNTAGFVISTQSRSDAATSRTGLIRCIC